MTNKIERFYQLMHRNDGVLGVIGQFHSGEWSLDEDTLAHEKKDFRERMGNGMSGKDDIYHIPLLLRPVGAILMHKLDHTDFTDREQFEAFRKVYETFFNENTYGAARTFYKSMEFADSIVKLDWI